MLSASVVIATYNGEKFLRDQLDSIIPQLRDCDEVVISDDGSTDGTLDIINEYVKKYSIINYYEVRGEVLLRILNLELRRLRKI